MTSKLFAIMALLLVPMASRAETQPTSSNYLDVGGVKLWYEECGSQNSPAVVLLHDGLLQSITWDGVWPALCAKYHVVRYDRRGYGRSETAKAPFVPEDDLLKIMRQVHMTRAFVWGNSSGGGLALDFALAHPEMVEGLFLIGPVVHGMASSDYFNERGSRNGKVSVTRTVATSSPEQRRQRAEELRRGRDAQRRPLRNGLRKVPGVVSQQPVGLAGHRRQEDRNISDMPDQVPARSNQLFFWVRNDLRVGQLD